MSWSIQCENGCVPAEAIFNPCCAASFASSVRRLTTCCRASRASLQISVASSTIDWCNSGLTRFSKTNLPSARICWMCERRSRVSGSIIWNSSSIPRVKTWSLLAMVLDFLNHFCRRRNVFVYNKESGLAAAGSHVDNWRIRQPHHRAADLPGKQKWIGINEHRLKFPIGLAKDWKLFRGEIDGLLNHIIGRKRRCDCLFPRALVQLRSKVNPVSAVVVVRLEHQSCSMLANKIDQHDAVAVVRRSPIRHSSRPRNGTRNGCALFGGEPTRVAFVGQQLEAGLLMHDFASERIYQTNMMIRVGAHQRMRFIVLREEFVNNYAFVDEIDFKIATAQAPAIVFQLIRRTDNRAHTARREMIFQQDELSCCRQIFPIHDRDVWDAVAIPFAVNRQ